MAMRKKTTRKQNKRFGKQVVRAHVKNVQPTWPMRGGYRF